MTQYVGVVYQPGLNPVMATPPTDDETAALNEATKIVDDLNAMQSGMVLAWYPIAVPIKEKCVT